MKSFFIICIALVSVFFSGFAQPSVYQHQVSKDVRIKEFSLKKKLMLEGYDVVSYHLPSGPRKGSKNIQETYKGVTYFFTSESNRAKFLTDPEMYEPLYGGWCAYAMLEGKKTKVDPETYKIVDGHLLVFYNGIWGDTLKFWNDKHDAQTNDRQLIQTADSAWDALLK